MGARLGSSADAGKSVPAALYTTLAHEEFEGAVRFAIALGGDTGTIAAMTGAIGGARGGASSIPARWLECLEDAGRGRSHVELLVPALCRLGHVKQRSRAGDL